MSDDLARTAADLLRLARRAWAEQRAGETRTLVDGAIVCARAAGALDVLAGAERLSAALDYAAGDLARAEAHYRRAAQSYAELGDTLAAGRLEASVAFVAYDRGDASSALETLDRVQARVATFEGSEPRKDELAAFVVGYRGNIARQAGALDEARAAYRRAIELARETGATVPLATFAMDLGAAELAAGRPADAIVWLGRAARWVERVPAELEPRELLVALVAHYEALASFALGRGAGVDVDQAGPASLASVREWLSDATGGGTRAPSIDAALERRLARIERDSAVYEHARLGVRIVRALVRAETPVDVVIVARDGSWIARGASVADLGSRAPLRRALEALARSPHRELSLDELVRVAWPGERMDARSARNRVHVALSTLRSLGLGDALVRTPRGYALDPRRCRVR